MLKRNIQVIFRLNKEEHQRLQKLVKKTGLSQETYIRTVLTNATVFFLAEEYAENYNWLKAKVLEIQAAVTLPEKA